MKISVILPTFNEKDNIIELINQLIVVMRTHRYKYEICVIDDNSPDKTGKICQEYFSKNKNIKTLIRLKNKGFASAICYGIKKSTGDTIVVMDTDFSHDPKEIPVMLSKIKNFDIVIGSRYARKGGGENKKRYLMSKIYNTYLRYLLKIDISDFLFGFFCIKKEFLVKNHLLNNDIFTGFGDYFIRLTYYIDKSGGKFVEIPTYYKNRIYGETKSNLVKMIFTYTGTSLQLYKQNFIK